MIFVIIGSPRTKKNSQRIFRNKRTGRIRIVPSKSASDWSVKAVEQLRQQNADVLELARPLNCKALIYRDALRGDAVNYYQAIADALQESGAVIDDKWITQWDGSRILVDRIVPRVEITLSFV